MDYLNIYKFLLFSTALLATIVLQSVSSQSTLVSAVLVGLKDNNAVADLMTDEGDTVTLICHIIGYQPNQILSISRVTNAGATESLLWNNSFQPSDTTQHIQFDGYIEIAPGSLLYTMVINNVTKLDAGRYSCVVFNSEGNRFTPASNDESNLRILHLPDPMYPTCNILSQDKSLTRYEGDRVTLKCISEIGDPEVFLDWKLSIRTGPYLPRPHEIVEDGFFKTEIIIDLEFGHNGISFDCILTSGLDFYYHPKCSIGPYSIQRRSTIPKPEVTDAPRKSTLGNVQSRTMSPTSSDSTDGNNPTLDASSFPVKDNSQLGTAAIAGICVIIVLLFCIMIIFAAAYLIKTNKYWSPSALKGPLSHDSPDAGNASLDVNDIGPKLLGFKKRFSRKVTLKSKQQYEPNANAGYEYENKMLANTTSFDTIAENNGFGTTPLSSRRPIPEVNPVAETEPDEFNHRDNTSPLSQQSNQQFLENNDTFGFPSSSLEPADKSSTEQPKDAPSSTPDQDSLTPESPTPRTPSSLSVSGEELEGEWVSASQAETPPVPPVVDPTSPTNLPQDVMDILMDLDLDLFANETTEDTEL